MKVSCCSPPAKVRWLASPPRHSLPSEHRLILCNPERYQRQMSGIEKVMNYEYPRFNVLCQKKKKKQHLPIHPHIHTCMHTKKTQRRRPKPNLALYWIIVWNLLLNDNVRAGTHQRGLLSTERAWCDAVIRCCLIVINVTVTQFYNLWRFWNTSSYTYTAAFALK